MKPKGDNCYSCTRAELLSEMEKGAVLRWWNYGPMLYAVEPFPRKELHPRRDTVRQLIRDGVIVESDDASESQRKFGLATYRLAAATAVQAQE